MYYGEIKKCDIANGIGIRVSLFVSGCTNRCKGCFQPQTWDFCYGRPFSDETEQIILNELEKPFVKGLSVLGGEPFEPSNQKDLLPLLETVKKRYPNKDIWIFTGFRLGDELLKEGAYPRTPDTDHILSLADVLVDGRFIEDQKDITLRFRGSRNQRIIDLKQTLISGSVVLWNDESL